MCVCVKRAFIYIKCVGTCTVFSSPCFSFKRRVNDVLIGRVISTQCFTNPSHTNTPLASRYFVQGLFVSLCTLPQLLKKPKHLNSTSQNIHKNAHGRYPHYPWRLETQVWCTLTSETRHKTKTLFLYKYGPRFWTPQLLSL